MRKQSLLLPLVVVTFMSTSMHASWWSSDNQQQQQQIDQLHTQLDEQRQKDDGLGGVIIILGIGCVVALVVGAGIHQVLWDVHLEDFVWIFLFKIQHDAATLELMHVSNGPMHHHCVSNVLGCIRCFDGDFISG